MTTQRDYTFFDRLCLSLDQAVRAVTGDAKTSGKPYPAQAVEHEPALSDEQRKHSAALMRINHAGEVCAQALYHGQGLVSRASATQAKLQEAAIEEGDHLSWCKMRLNELNSHTSYFNPLWYMGSFCIGMTAGMIGDAWSLGFVVETERQVIKHLQGHLAILPAQDVRSYQILQQMEMDETKHRDEAMAAGARELPEPVKMGMSLVSKVMVRTAFWV